METAQRHHTTLHAGIALVLALTLVAPPLFIVAEGNHDCSGDKCPVCEVMLGAEQLSQQGASIPDPACGATLAALVVLVVAAAFLAPVSRETLISLKVRMDE